MSLSPSAVQNVGHTLEALAQGLYISAFYRSSIVLFGRKHRAPLYLLSAISLLLFVFELTHFAAGICQNIRGATSGASVDGSVAARFRCYSFVATTATVNTFMVYRCFVVWNSRRRIILFPSILCLASLGLGVWLAATYSQTSLSMFKTAMVPELFCILNLVFNLFLSGLIIHRIWNIQCEISKGVETDNRFIGRMSSLVIESGSLFVALSLALVAAVYATGVAAIGVIIGCTVPLQGLIVSCIILRIGRGISHGDPATSIPIEFRDSVFSHIKGTYGPTTSLAHDEIETGRRDRLRFDLNN